MNPKQRQRPCPTLAKDLAVDSFVLGADHQMVKVTWHQIDVRKFCGIVDFCTKSTKMVVTDSHPMPSEHGEVKEAGSLEKGGDVLVATGPGNDP